MPTPYYVESQLWIKRVIDNDLIMYNIQNDFKKRVKLIISGSFFSWNNIIQVPFRK